MFFKKEAVMRRGNTEVSKSGTITMRKKLDEIFLIIGFGVNIGILSIVLFALAATYLRP